MARYSVQDTSRLRDVEAELGCLREGDRNTFEWLAPMLTHVTGAEKALLSSYSPSGDGVCVERGAVAGLSPAIVAAINQFIDGQPVGWTSYNPMRPEPSQRNLALTMREVMALIDYRTPPMVTHIYPRFGLHACDQLRVLVCEGSSLLGYIGLFQSRDFDKRQQRLLTRLVPAMRRRFSTERLLTTAGPTKTLLDAALEEISTAAFILGEQGIVLEANIAGRAWLEREGLSGRRALREAARVPQRAMVTGFRVTPVTSPGVAPRYLVVRTGDPDRAAQVARAGTRWGFTPRELAILAYLANGVATRTIAAELAVVERTVEAHLTRMFEKAQVGSRAELVAKAWSEGR